MDTTVGTKHPLQDYSARSGKSIKAIAAEVGCSRQAIYRLMSGAHQDTFELLKRVSAATNGEVPVEAFILAAPSKDDSDGQPTGGSA